MTICEVLNTYLYSVTYLLEHFKMLTILWIQRQLRQTYASYFYIMYIIPRAIKLMICLN